MRSPATPVRSSPQTSDEGGHSRLALLDDDFPGRVERAQEYERAAAAKLRELITRSEELYAQAARTLAVFEASLEARRATLRRLGYLIEKERRPHG